MPQAQTLRVKGYAELMRALQLASKEDRKAVRDEIRQAGQVVRQGAAMRIAPLNARTAHGYRVIVRQRGVSVEQSLRKTTGKHPEWGEHQIARALEPSLMANEDRTVREIEAALDRITDRFNQGGTWTT